MRLHFSGSLKERLALDSPSSNCAAKLTKAKWFNGEAGKAVIETIEGILLPLEYGTVQIILWIMGIISIGLILLYSLFSGEEEEEEEG